MDPKSVRLLCFIICVVFVHDFSVAELIPTVSKFISYNCTGQDTAGLQPDHLS